MRQARTVAALPGRMDGVEERFAAVEVSVAAAFEELRDEIVRLRGLVQTMVDTETEVATLVGRLVAELTRRVDDVELALSPRTGGSGALGGTEPGGDLPGGPS